MYYGVAVESSDKVKNVVLMGPLARNAINDVLYYQEVKTPYLYAQRILDNDHHRIAPDHSFLIDFSHLS